MDLGIQGLRVLVTAGANGIGRDIARAFVGEGASVHVCDVDDKQLKKLASASIRSCQDSWKASGSAESWRVRRKREKFPCRKRKLSLSPTSP